MHVPYPRANATDHWSKNPRKADVSITNVLMKFQSKESTPAGYNHGNIAANTISIE